MTIATATEAVLDSQPISEFCDWRERAPRRPPARALARRQNPRRSLAQRPLLSARGAGPGGRPLRRGQGQRQPSQGASPRSSRLSRADRHDPQRHVPQRRGAVWRFPLQSQARPGRAARVGCHARAGERRLLAQRRHARLVRRLDQWIVEAITRVTSVDLVADPATTGGLFEAASLPTAGKHHHNRPPTRRPPNRPARRRSRPTRPRIRCLIPRLRRQTIRPIRPPRPNPLPHHQPKRRPWHHRPWKTWSRSTRPG